jgi:TRAP-type mannitol/chloroaromatic compound transport system permease large subunit
MREPGASTFIVVDADQWGIAVGDIEKAEVQPGLVVNQ